MIKLRVYLKCGIYKRTTKEGCYMKLDFNLNLSQQQKLVMTQNMQLSINILQGA